MPTSSILALSDGGHLDFRTIPNLPAAFAEDGREPLLTTHHINAVPLGILRPLISESVDFAPPDGMHLDFRTVPNLPVVLPEEDRKHRSLFRKHIR